MNGGGGGGECTVGMGKTMVCLSVILANPYSPTAPITLAKVQTLESRTDCALNEPNMIRRTTDGPPSLIAYACLGTRAGAGPQPTVCIHLDFDLCESNWSVEGRDREVCAAFGRR